MYLVRQNYGEWIAVSSKTLREAKKASEHIAMVAGADLYVGVIVDKRPVAIAKKIGCEMRDDWTGKWISL